MVELPPSLELRRAITVRVTPEASLVPVVTLVLWLGCTAVGALGFVLPYARAQLQKKSEPPPVLAQRIEVEVKPEPVQVATAPASLPRFEQPPEAPPVVSAPAAPPLAVTEATPQIAFAVPIEAPATVVATASEASFRTPEIAPQPAPQAEPAPQPLVFGEGAGKQPAPEYPRQALREGQEGTVLVRFTVGENGRVLSATAANPSPWPLLNSAAVRVIRDRWRFPAGGIRVYEVPIHFQINR